MQRVPGQLYLPVHALRCPFSLVNPADQQQWADLAGMSKCQNGGSLRTSSPGSLTHKNPKNPELALDLQQDSLLATVWMCADVGKIN